MTRKDKETKEDIARRLYYATPGGAGPFRWEAWPIRWIAWALRVQADVVRHWVKPDPAKVKRAENLKLHREKRRRKDKEQ